jgi:hypothetical protein
MSDFRIDQITNQAGTAGPQIAGITTFSSTSGLVMPSGPTEYRGGRGRGVFGGGYTNSPAATSTNIIDYITISTTGNALDFGDLTSGIQDAHSCSSSTRGLFASVADNRIDKRYSSATGNSIRGLWGGGGNPSVYTTIDYVIIASLGNSIRFGDLTFAREGLSACSSPTRGVFGGGQTPATLNIIDYITIASTGNAQDFGDLTLDRRFPGSCSSLTRGLWGGGNNSSNTNIIDYITIASTGNAIDFGDLTQARSGCSGTSSAIRGVFGGGQTPTDVNTIDYVTIASIGNAIDFGDLTRTAARHISSCSDAHGGLGD